MAEAKAKAPRVEIAAIGMGSRNRCTNRSYVKGALNPEPGPEAMDVPVANVTIENVMTKGQSIAAAVPCGSTRLRRALPRITPAAVPPPIAHRFPPRRKTFFSWNTRSET
jgi:hypothetical protein